MLAVEDIHRGPIVAGYIQEGSVPMAHCNSKDSSMRFGGEVDVWPRGRLITPLASRGLGPPSTSITETD